MHKSAIVNARIHPKLKHQAEVILRKVGLSSAEAVRLFYTQVCLCGGLPFKVRVPNKKTLKTIKAAELGKTHRAKSVDALFDELDEC